MKLVCFFILFGFAVVSIAKDSVLDFEGDVIEGERRRPELFLQLSNDQLDMKDLMYIREDFNDYLEYDKKVKPRYFKLKKK